jgi:hypothetical protein
MDLGRGGVCLRRDLYKDDFAELNVGRRSTAVKPVNKNKNKNKNKKQKNTQKNFHMN